MKRILGHKNAPEIGNNCRSFARPFDGGGGSWLDEPKSQNIGEEGSCLLTLEAHKGGACAFIVY